MKATRGFYAVEDKILSEIIYEDGMLQADDEKTYEVEIGELEDDLVKKLKEFCEKNQVHPNVIGQHLIKEFINYNQKLPNEYLLEHLRDLTKKYLNT